MTTQERIALNPVMAALALNIARLQIEGKDDATKAEFKRACDNYGGYNGLFLAQFSDMVGHFAVELRLL